MPERILEKQAQTGTPTRKSRAAESSVPQEFHPLLALQQSHGNRFVQRMVASAREEEVRGGEEAPPAVETAIRQAQGGGQALPAEVRGPMESFFDADLSAVRVHSDARADTLSRELNARAFTVGQDIFFRQGELDPGTSSGRELLVHETTHTRQQGGSGVQGKLTVNQPGDELEQEADQVARAFGTGSPATGEDPSAFGTALIRRQKAPPVTSWYQEVLDEIEKAATGNFILLARVMPLLKKLQELVEAIDQEQAQSVITLLDELLALDAGNLSDFFPSRGLVAEVISRMLLLGLDEEAAKLRVWYLDLEQQRAPHPRPRVRDFSPEMSLWEKVLERLVARIPQRGAATALTVLDALLALLGQMSDELAGLDPAELKADEERRKGASTADLPTFGGLAQHDNSIIVYRDTLIQLQRQTFRAIQVDYQVVFDQAIEDLRTGKDSRLLDLAKQRLGELLSLIEPKEPAKRSAQLEVEITRSKFTEEGGRHLDFFLAGKEAERRSAGFEYYEAEPGTGQGEKTLSFGQIFRIRREQIRFLEGLYGLPQAKGGQPTAEATENRAAISQLGAEGLKLESNDDWRRFLLKKFELRKAKEGKAAAFTATIELLKEYLRIFTSHTPYNIEDFGDNYLDKAFPRALTGQLIHDCGVYALRIAYMLSLLRDHSELQLRFRFIILPVHVGLIITGEGLPLYVTHNDNISVFSPEEVAEKREAWKGLNEAGEPQAPTGKESEEQFLAEVAGREFIPSADLPYKLIEVPDTRGTAGAAKANLWSHYIKIAQTDLFGPKVHDPESPHFQFDLRYLDLLKRIQAHHNTELAQFWNVKAKAAWFEHEPKLRKALDAIQQAKTDNDPKQAAEAEEAYKAELSLYQGVMDAAIAPVIAAYNSQVRVPSATISQYIHDHPEVIQKNVPLTHSLRIEEVFGLTTWWQERYSDHLDRLRSRQDLETPFGVDESKVLWPMG